MTQSTAPYSIANESGAQFRADVNTHLTAIVSLNPGTVAPSPTFSNMFWADLGSLLLKQRNTANSAWITIGSLDTSYFGLLPNSLTSARIFVGNGSNVATGVAMSGDAVIDNAGAVTVSKIGGKAVSLGGNVTGTGAYTLAYTLSNNTAITFPTSGTLATISGTEILTNKTFDTAGTGNVFKVNGVQISDKTGTGKAVLDTSPSLVTPNIGAAIATSINFGGSSLSSYVENGSWTPTFAGSTTAGSNTYTNNIGLYIRIGKLVIAWAYVIMSSKDGSMAGNVQINGLPYVASGTLNFPAALARIASISLDAGNTMFTAQIQAGNSYINLEECGSNSRQFLPVANLSNSSSVFATIVYSV